MTHAATQTPSELDAALHRYERLGRPSLPLRGYRCDRLPGRARRGLYRAADGAPVFEPDGHILSWEPSGDRSHIAVQCAAAADEEAVLVIVDAATGDVTEFEDVRCRYDPMLWDTASSRLSTVAAGSLVDVDVDSMTVVAVEDLPDGRWRLFPGGRDGLLTHSRPGRPTAIVDRATRTRIGQALAVTAIVDCGGQAVYGDGRGLYAIDPNTGRRLWAWSDPDVTPTGVAVSDDRLVVSGVRYGRSVVLEIVDGVVVDDIDPETTLGPVTVSALGRADGAAVPVDATAGVTVLVESFTVPPTQMSLDDLRNGERLASSAAVRRLTVRADDGADLSVVVAEPEAEGPRPMILTCYGGFGVCALPEFEPTAAAWIESGGSYAVAQVRGGGEYGPAWRAAGYGAVKRRGVDDLMCIARGLVAAGVTTPELLVLAGASHGGVLAASCAFGAPDVCAGVVATAAPLDLTRLDEHPLGHRWAAEFGADGTAEGDARLTSLSPLHRAARLTDTDVDTVPAFLGVVLGQDSRVSGDATRRTVEAVHASGARAELAEYDDAGHGGNHLDALHAMGVDLLAFAAEATNGSTS
ncbi:prolyl oligopeptidase family serine peptidase [Gordonia sp. (in: high G+C Gram-positive bacteria)]|uniref:prolyl oligopeptidase family serine peptidase n=1 Tax=Gordonia sp. (in: high G+C Gram-positive bacteria) TaxID=84139 RepID=UPI003F9E8088